jgi:hypothetical protein
MIFMSILHLYIYCRWDRWEVSSKVFHAGQKQKHLSNVTGLTALEQKMLFHKDEPGAVNISQGGKATTQPQLMLRTNTSMQYLGLTDLSATMNVSGKKGFVDSGLQFTKQSKSDHLLTGRALGRQAAETSKKQADRPHPAGTQPTELPISRSEKTKTNSKRVQKQEPKLEFAPPQRVNMKEERLQNQHRIVFSPHYDDAVLSLGGMLSVDPANTTIITVFAGKPLYPVTTAYDESCNFRDSHHALMVRSEENRRSLEHLGVSFRDLRYIDFQYASLYWPSYVPSIQHNYALIGLIDRTQLQRQRKEDLRKKLAADIKGILNSYLGNAAAGTRLEVYSSLGRAASDHPDHEILNLAIMDLALSERNNPSITWLFYEDFPYVLRHADKNESSTAVSQVSKLLDSESEPMQDKMQGRLANEMLLDLTRISDGLQARLDATIRESNSWAKRDSEKEALFVPKAHMYDQGHYRRKKSAINLYRSQVSACSNMIVLGIYCNLHIDDSAS